MSSFHVLWLTARSIVEPKVSACWSDNAHRAFVQVGVAVLSLVLSSCLMMSARPEPFASFRVEATNEGGIEKQISVSDDRVVSLGYARQPSRAEAFKNLPQPNAWLAKTLAEERDYADGRFHIILSPEHETQSLWVSFYEYGRDQFTSEGMARFDQLRSRIEAAGLHTSVPPRESGSHARSGETPQEFNAKHPLRTVGERVSEFVPAIVMLLIYAALILLPGLLLLRTAARKLRTLVQQRLALSIGTTVLLAPMPLPAGIFGPVLFIPFALFAPVMGSMAVRFWPWVLGSFVATFAFAWFCSRYIAVVDDDDEIEDQRRR